MKDPLPEPVMEEAQQMIHVIRGQRVILDSDLARWYGVTTRRLNEQVKRNRKKFPDEFAFQLVHKEVTNLKSQIATSSLGHGGTRKLPLVFTEHGALMAANVLNSDRAVTMSIFLIRAFVRLRETALTNAELLKRLDHVDGTLLEHDAALRDLYEKMRELLMPAQPSRKQIGFHVKERSATYRFSRS
ncbi:MAG: ORF6N domain-containing protein [bacterium]